MDLQAMQELRLAWPLLEWVCKFAQSIQTHTNKVQVLQALQLPLV